jgi:CRISPR/Cas system CMR-associated protein Cmr5 small subunit
VELAVGVTFILVRHENVKAALLVQLCLAAIFLVMLIANMLANEYTADAQEKRKSQIDHVKIASAELSSILEIINSKNFTPELKKSVEKAYDAMRASPVKNHPDVMQIETEILFTIDRLKTAVTIGNENDSQIISNDLSAMIAERNHRLKISN